MKSIRSWVYRESKKYREFFPDKPQNAHTFRILDTFGYSRLKKTNASNRQTSKDSQKTVVKKIRLQLQKYHNSKIASEVLKELANKDLRAIFVFFAKLKLDFQQKHERGSITNNQKKIVDNRSTNIIS